MPCPDEECHDRVVKIDHALYGEDGTKGIVGCLKSKMPKKYVWVALCVFGIPLLTFGSRLWSDSKSNDLKYVAKSEKHEERIEVLEERYKNISSTLSEIKTTQGDIQQDIKLLIRGIDGSTD